jgi:hypothetical protein
MLLGKCGVCGGGGGTTVHRKQSSPSFGKGPAGSGPSPWHDGVYGGGWGSVSLCPLCSRQSCSQACPRRLRGHRGLPAHPSFAGFCSRPAPHLGSGPGPKAGPRPEELCPRVPPGGGESGGWGDGSIEKEGGVPATFLGGWGVSQRCRDGWGMVLGRLGEEEGDPDPSGHLAWSPRIVSMQQERVGWDKRKDFLSLGRRCCLARQPNTQAQADSLGRWRKKSWA